ncbi:MAG: transposase [Gemmataceae bacterium]
MARKTYTREFQLQAVRMLTDQGTSVAEVARRLGVGENCLRNWRAAAREKGEAAFPGHGNPSPAEDELRRLRAEVHRLKVGRDLP